MAEVKAKKKTRKKRTANHIVVERGTPCRHCGHEFDHKITHTYPNGNRRVLCGARGKGGCGKPFIIQRGE